jgi:hypothetical protein
MSKSKIVGIMALIAFAMAILLVGNAAAGEIFKARNVTHTTKWQQIDVGDEDGHVIVVSESKGVTTNLEGKWFAYGWFYRDTALLDLNLKTGVGSAHGYWECTDRDGNKYYGTGEGRLLKGGKFGTGYWGLIWKVVKGTGKFEGMQGKGTSQGYLVGDQSYTDWEGEFELPR